MIKTTVKPVANDYGRSAVFRGSKLLGYITHRCGNWKATSGKDRVNGNYIGKFGGKRDAIDAVVGASYCQIDGNLFPDDLTILRISAISIDASPVPGATPTVAARVHYNSFKSTGNTSLSRASRSSMMFIDLDKGEIQCAGKIMQFTNQDEMLKKVGIAIRSHLTQGQA